VSLAFTVLGNSGSYPTPEGACSGYLVEAGGTRVWVDAGPGTLANLQRHVAPDAVDGIVLTHAHPDHWADLMSYFVIVRHFRPRTGLPVWSPARVRTLVTEVLGDLAPNFDWIDVRDGSVAKLGDLTFTFARTDHPPETLAIRIEGGGSVLGYSADTGPGWSLSELGPGIDCALVEASFTRDQERGGLHLSARQAAITAKAARAPRLVLTHLQPGLDPEVLRAEAAEAFGGPVELAVENERYVV
jgi:ribonuclease BN (tRNA processing enzyme)